MAHIDISDITEKETFRDEKEKELLRVTRHIPHFEGEKELCDKLNGFYTEAAREFRTFCAKKYAPALRRGKKEENSVCCGASMNWTLTFQNEELLSLLSDIAVFDGKTRHLRRFCHTWNLAAQVPLSAKQIFDTSVASRKRFLSAVCEKVARKEGGFPYYHDAERRAKRYFEIERFYLTPRGVAFYYPDGLLFPSEGRFPAYVVPYDTVRLMPLDKG